MEKIIGALMILGMIIGLYHGNVEAVILGVMGVVTFKGL